MTYAADDFLVVRIPRTGSASLRMALSTKDPRRFFRRMAKPHSKHAFYSDLVRLRPEYHHMKRKIVVVRNTYERLASLWTWLRKDNHTYLNFADWLTFSPLSEDRDLYYMNPYFPQTLWFDDSFEPWQLVDLKERYEETFGGEFTDYLGKSHKGDWRRLYTPDTLALVLARFRPEIERFKYRFRDA